MGIAFLFQEYYTGEFYFDFDAYIHCSLILLIVKVVIFWTTDFEQVSIISPSFMDSYRWSLYRALAVLVAILIYLFISKNVTVSRAYIFTHFSLQFIGVFLTHRYFPEIFAKISFKGKRRQNVLFIGPIKKALRMKNWMKQKGSLGIRSVGVVCKGEEEGEMEGLKIISEEREIGEVIKNLKISQVILLELPDQKNDLKGLFVFFEKFGIRLVIINDLEEILGHSVVMTEDDGFQTITMRFEPLENPFNRALKRALDVVVSLPVVLFVLPPLALIVSIFQKRQSPGPLFVSQARGGIQGHHFKMLKFRTMHTNNQTIAKQAKKNDPRIYPAGFFFRKYSLDEIPQFWNVFKGEMSVVGPRPHLVEHDDAFSEVTGNYLVRSYVKPGITGFAQVKGLRGATTQTRDIHDRVASDIYYIENWSLMMDLIVIFKTFKHVISPPSSAV